jgi:predicted transcriptional regulator
MEAGKKLVPYSVYISQDHYEKLRELAKERKASSLIRDAISSILDGGDVFTAGYNRGLKDAAEVIYSSKEAQMIAVSGRDLGVVLSEQIQSLEK